jgi:predicted GTPase
MTIADYLLGVQYTPHGSIHTHMVIAMGKIPDELTKAGLTPQAIETLREIAQREVAARPPTIGLIGVSGVGKSFTINTLFKTELETSDTVACTKEFKAIDLGLEFTKGRAIGTAVGLMIIDAPGLWEDMKRDPEYLSMYREHLSQCDVVLWIMTARNRAVALDQLYLEQLHQFHPKIIFGVNQVDLIEPNGLGR